MISHLCNGLIYNSGLFAGFYSTINLGDASIATENEEVLVLEDGSDDKLITENGMVSGSISGFSGYLKTFTSASGFDIEFEQTGEVYDIQEIGRDKMKDIDCGANDCPVAPVTKITIKNTSNLTYNNGLIFLNGGDSMSFTLKKLTGTSCDFKYYWILRENSYDYISYITEQQYDNCKIPPQFGGTGVELDFSQLGNYSGQFGNLYVHQDVMYIDDGGTLHQMGQFTEV